MCFFIGTCSGLANSYLLRGLVLINYWKLSRYCSLVLQLPVRCSHNSTPTCRSKNHNQITPSFTMVCSRLLVDGDEWKKGRASFLVFALARPMFSLLPNCREPAVTTWKMQVCDKTCGVCRPLGFWKSRKLHQFGNLRCQSKKSWYWRYTEKKIKV